jgi:hypothetical protein
MHIVYKKTDRSVGRTFFDGTCWQSDNAGSIIRGSPTAVSQPDGVHVFAIGQDQRMWMSTFASGVWGPWSSLSELTATSAIALRGWPSASTSGSDVAVWVQESSATDDGVPTLFRRTGSTWSAMSVHSSRCWGSPIANAAGAFCGTPTDTIAFESLAGVSTDLGGWAE